MFLDLAWHLHCVKAPLRQCLQLLHTCLSTILQGAACANHATYPSVFHARLSMQNTFHVDSHVLPSCN